MTNNYPVTGLVTGVSGIGAGYVRIFLAKGQKIFAVDRLQSALDALGDDPNLIKILADIGTKEGLAKIGQVVGETPVNYVLCAAGKSLELCFCVLVRYFRKFCFVFAFLRFANGTLTIFSFHFLSISNSRCPPRWNRNGVP